MDINTIRNRLSKIIRDIQYEKIEIMKLVGRESMTIIKPTLSLHKNLLT